jgi:hypothetical protein
MLRENTRRAVLVAHIAGVTGLASQPLERPAAWWPVALGLAILVLAWWVA